MVCLQMALAADQSVANRVAALTKADLARSAQFSDRSKLQLQGLPILPTTTIGSFPQTKEIRSLRNQFIRGKITKAEYEAQIDQQISFMISIQEVSLSISSKYIQVIASVSNKYLSIHIAGTRFGHSCSWRARAYGHG